MMTWLTRAFAFCGLVLAAAVLSGCPSGGGGSSNRTEGIVSIRKAYMAATNRLGRPPRDLDELKPSLAAEGNVEELLVSPNDGLPYVIVYGADPGKHVVAFEAKGVDGVRLVVDRAQFPRRVTEEQFVSLSFPPGYKKPAGLK
jgi:hypothetical protein